MSIDTINNLRKSHESSAMIVVGIDVVGDKRVRKGSSYPIFVGSQSESAQVAEYTMGSRATVAAATYAYIIGNNETVDSQSLQMAAAGSIVDDFPDPDLKGASKEIVELAKNDGLIDESKGFRLFGVNFLPLNEVLTYSIRPYLQNLSGVTDACDKICVDADIPSPKFRMPLSSLTSSEATKLNTHLLQLIDYQHQTIDLVLGQDFVLTKEKEDSPARLLSGIKALAECAWTLGEWGASTSIWMGERGQTLRGLRDSYRFYSKDVISGVEECTETLLKSSESLIKGKITRIPVKSVRREAFADVGRILIESEQVESAVAILEQENSFEVVWRMNSKGIQDIIPALWNAGLTATTTSSQSIRVEGTPDAEAALMKVIEEIW